MGERPDRPLFVGNFEYDAEERDVIRLMEKYGRVDKIDMKQGFAFVYMRYKEDGDEAVQRLNQMEWGYKKRPLRVEWAQKTEADRKRDTRPSRTLFVVNFDVRRTTEHDIERYFARYGRLLRVQIKKNYSFVQFADVESAVRALERCNGAQMGGRTLAVEFVQNEDPNIRVPDLGRDGGDRGYDRDRGRGGYRGRSRSRSQSRSRPRRSPDRRSPVRRSPIRRSPDRRSPPRRSPPRRSPDRRSPVRRASPDRRSPPRRSPDRSPPQHERRASPPRPRSASRSPDRRDRSPSYDR